MTLNRAQLALVKAEAVAFLDRTLPGLTDRDRMFFEQGAQWGVRMGLRLEEAMRPSTPSPAPSPKPLVVEPVTGVTMTFNRGAAPSPKQEPTA